MINGKNDLIEIIRFNKTPFWKIKRSEKGEVITESQGENISVDEGILQLEKAVQLLQPGTYFIEMYDNPKLRNNWKKDSFQIPQNGINTGIGNSNTGISHVQSLIDNERLKFDIERKENEITQLRRENQELQNELYSVEHNFKKNIGPYVGHIIREFVPNAKKVVINESATISGVDNQRADEINETLEKLLNEWSDLDKDFITVIQKIVNIAKNDIANYNQYKTILLGTK